MAEPNDAEIDAAEAGGKLARGSEPRAVSACYDRRLKKIAVELTSGASFAFPAHLAEGLEGAGEEDLAVVEVLGSGYGLHWEGLDVDLSIPGLVAGIFGTQRYMAQRAGQATSATKAAAARANGAKGGRPRKRA